MAELERERDVLTSANSTMSAELQAQSESSAAEVESLQRRFYEESNAKDTALVLVHQYQTQHLEVRYRLGMCKQSVPGVRLTGLKVPRRKNSLETEQNR